MKPQPKREVAVSFSSKASGIIQLYATPDAAAELTEFGSLFCYGDSHYGLTLDARYDFDEVLAYIQNYSK